MRILLVSNSGFQYLSSVVPALEQRGVRFHSLSTDALKNKDQGLGRLKLRAVRQYYFDRSYLAQFRKIIADFSPDVVHVTGLRSTLIKTMAALRAFPRIALVHERISAGGMNIFSPLDWALFRHPRIDRIIMPSHAMLNNWMGNPFLRRMVRPDRCEVLHYAIEAPAPLDAEARRDLRRSLGLDENAFIVGTACYIRPWKNVEFVAEVVASIQTEGPLYFAVIGPENRDRAYMNRIRAAGGARLKLLGHVPNAGRVMAAFDAYVTPTALPGESFGVAFAEAMAHAVPSLTMNFGASAELCEHGISGYALPCDKHAWRSAIEELMQDRAKAAAIGEAGRRRIATSFSPAIVAENYLTVYRRAVRHRSSEK